MALARPDSATPSPPFACKNSWDDALSMAPKPSAVPFANLLLPYFCRLALSLGPDGGSSTRSQLLLFSSSEHYMLLLFSITSENSLESPDRLPWLLLCEVKAKLCCFVVISFSGICWNRLIIESLPLIERF